MWWIWTSKIGSNSDLQNKIEYESDTNEKQYYEARLALMQGGIAIIRVGGTSVQVKEKQDRIIDSLDSVCG